ncbi:MAG: EfeM/EfeO family lipoprotein [Nocardioides sp.]
MKPTSSRARSGPVGTGSRRTCGLPGRRGTSRSSPPSAPLSPTQLVADTEELESRIEELTFTVDQIANGSRGLMEEVATGKVTGEEEYWSRTDLWDFQANVDGAHEAFEALEPILARRDPELVETLDARFESLQGLLDAQRKGDGFVSYDQVPAAEIKALADAVNAVSEPLSRVGAVVLGG